VHVVSSTDAELLANDRVLVSSSESGVEAHGVPTVVSVRRGSIELLPGPFRRLPRIRRPSQLTLDETGQAPTCPDFSDPLRLSPAQLTHAVGASPAAHAALGAIVFPRRHPRGDGVEVKRLSPEETGERLLEARFGLRTGGEAPTLFSRLVGVSRPVGADEGCIARLAGEVPGFEVRSARAAFAEPATAGIMLSRVLAARS
jgi:hypothetical protein